MRLIDRTVRRIVLALLVLPACARSDEHDETLAVKLSMESEHEAAAIEFRRLALGAEDPVAVGGYYWSAAHEYWKAGRFDAVDRMLNRAEDATQLIESQALMLRGEAAASAKMWDEAEFYFSSTLGGSLDEDALAFAARRLAGVRLRQEDVSGARDALEKSPLPTPDAVAAIDRFAAGRDKSPRIGGLLGLIPGLGYMYAGEYASGFRSIILNGLFIYGMVSTAEEEQWGAFTAITFFEITWYSGSIYGGIDASHRYNERRRQDAVRAITGGAVLQPDYSRLPLVSLRFGF